jgi:hypothetical protein
MFALISDHKDMVIAPLGCKGGEAGSLTGFSANDEYISITFSARRGSILRASKAILMWGIQKRHRAFSRFVFYLPLNSLASTASSRTSFWGTMAALGKMVRKQPGGS